MENFTFPTLPYQRPDFEALRRDIAGTIKALEAAGSYGEFRQLLLDFDQRSCQLDSMVSICHIRHTLDTADSFYSGEWSYIIQRLPEVSGDLVEFGNAVAASPYRPQLEQELGSQYFASIDLARRMY